MRRIGSGQEERWAAVGTLVRPDQNRRGKRRQAEAIGNLGAHRGFVILQDIEADEAGEDPQSPFDDAKADRNSNADSHASNSKRAQRVFSVICGNVTAS